MLAKIWPNKKVTLMPRFAWAAQELLTQGNCHAQERRWKIAALYRGAFAAAQIDLITTGNPPLTESHNWQPEEKAVIKSYGYADKDTYAAGVNSLQYANWHWRHADKTESLLCFQLAKISFDQCILDLEIPDTTICYLENPKGRKDADSPE